MSKKIMRMSYDFKRCRNLDGILEDTDSESNSDSDDPTDGNRSPGSSNIISLRSPKRKTGELSEQLKELNLLVDKTRKSKKRGKRPSLKRLAVEPATLNQILERRLLYESFRESVKGLTYAEDSLMMVMRKVQMIFTINSRLLCLSTSNLMGAAPRGHRWRFEYRCRDILSVAEAPRKDMAQFAAALDLLAKIKNTYPSMIIPTCDFPDGCLINPDVTLDLNNFLAKFKIFEESEFEQFEVPGTSGKGNFVCLARILTSTYTGRAVAPEYAAKIAVKMAYENLTGEDPNDDIYYTGDSCFRDSSFEFVESQVKYFYGVENKEECEAALMNMSIGKSKKRPKRSKTSQVAEVAGASGAVLQKEKASCSLSNAGGTTVQGNAAACRQIVEDLKTYILVRTISNASNSEGSQAAAGSMEDEEGFTVEDFELPLGFDSPLLGLIETVFEEDGTKEGDE